MGIILHFKFLCYFYRPNISNATNIISPGTIVGESADAHSMHGRLEDLLANNPAGRLGTPDDIAAMVDLLISEEGHFINGQMLQVNGGVITQV